MYLNSCSYFLISVTTIQPIQALVIILCLMYRICIWFTFIEPFDHKPQPTMNLKFKSNRNEPQNHNKKLWPFSTLFLWNVEIQHTYNPYNNLFGDDKRGWEGGCKTHYHRIQIIWWYNINNMIQWLLYCTVWCKFQSQGLHKVRVRHSQAISIHLYIHIWSGCICP